MRLDCREIRGKINEKQQQQGVYREQGIIVSCKSCFSGNFSGTEVFIYGVLFKVTLKLAQVSFFLDELGMVMFAVEPTFMCYVVRRADHTPSMGTFETAFMVRSSIHCNLFSL